MVLSSKNLFHAQLTQDFGAHSLAAGLLHKNQLSHHMPLTLTQITIFIILLQLNKTSTTKQNFTSMLKFKTNCQSIYFKLMIGVENKL